MLNFLTDPLLTLLYPQYCGSCGDLVDNASDGGACRTCWESTKIFGDSDVLCIKCGMFLAELPVNSESTCKQCEDHDYDFARAAGPYERALAATVLYLKQTPNVPLTAKTYIVEAFERVEMPSEFSVIPVPLSKRRFLERGFNQASLLAKVISSHTGRRFDEHSLARKKDTPMHRAAMDRKAREATVQNVFEVVRPGLIVGQNILLVDDLMTSGSTASQCAKALKQTGAEKVILLTLARAV